MLGFLGPNGAGKTTAMRAVFGLVELDGGEVLWDGRRSGWKSGCGSATCRRSAASTRGCRSAEQLEYFGTPARAERRRGARGGSALARAARPRRARRREGRRALARQPAARPARGSAAARAGAARPRRAVRRSRPGRSADARRRCSAARRRAARPCSSPATSSSSSRTSARRSRSSTAAASSPRGTWTHCRRASQRRRIELQLDGAPPQWLPDVAGVELVERRNGDLRLLAGRETSTRSRCSPAAERIGAGRRVQLRAALARRALPGAGGDSERRGARSRSSR